MKNSFDQNTHPSAHSIEHTHTDSDSGMNNTMNRGGLSELPQRIQQFGSSAMERVNNLSTTQKVVGGAVLALGAGWLTMNPNTRRSVINSTRGMMNSDRGKQIINSVKEKSKTVGKKTKKNK